MLRPGLLAHLRVALRHHWPHYLTEGISLALFLSGASLTLTALEHPGSPLHQALLSHGLLRRALLGVAMLFVVAGLVYNPWGRRSGAHINPAVTLGFWQLGQIKTADAVWYVLAQFAGAMLGGQLMTLLLGRYYAHPAVNYAVTQPIQEAHGQWIAFGAEFVITFIMMAVLLLALRSRHLEKLAGWLLGGLLALYIWLETPLSGMSLNPARTLGSAVAAGSYEGLWLYFVAPLLAAWLAAVGFHALFRDSPLRGCSLAGPPKAAGEKLPEHPRQ